MKTQMKPKITIILIAIAIGGSVGTIKINKKPRQVIESKISNRNALATGGLISEAH